ncbi:MAG: hypothetical protein JXL84_07665 [Deltaproteobacteria bacterium]|nr:hypothetical protein [Deltaproteobacteria bacterium]
MRRQLNELSWIKRVTLKPPLSPLAYWQLGRGESEVIEYARHQKNTIALLDDKDARRSASAMKIPVMGTLGIVARSALSGGTLSFDDMIRRLQDAGTYLDQGIISAVRRGLSRARS